MIIILQKSKLNILYCKTKKKIIIIKYKKKISVINAATFVPLIFINRDDVAVSLVVRYIVFLPTLAKEFIQLVKQSAFATLDDFGWNPIHAWCFADG